MRCLSCRRFSLSAVCATCRELYLTPAPKIRKLPDGLDVVSFYAYEAIEPFLLTKHLPHGWFVYRLLARSVCDGVSEGRGLYAVAVDDMPAGGYSHTSIVAKRLEKRGYRPLRGVLRARNRVSYAGESLAFRLAHPRAFEYSGPGGIEAVLVDDIVTTGLTLQEARNTLQNAGVRVVGAIVLADADRKG